MEKNIFDLIPRSLVHSYNTRVNAIISSTLVQTNLAAKLVLHKGINLYNSLPNELKCTNEFHKFKRALETYSLNN